MTETNLLTLTDIANRIGVSVGSMRTYHQRASRARRDGQATLGDLPEPQHRFERSPVWSVEQIDAWESARPGRGRTAARV